MHKTCELHCISYYSRLKLDATTSKTVKYTLRYKKLCTRLQANHIESIKFRKLMQGARENILREILPKNVMLRVRC